MISEFHRITVSQVNSNFLDFTAAEAIPYEPFYTLTTEAEVMSYDSIYPSTINRVNAEKDFLYQSTDHTINEMIEGRYVHINQSMMTQLDDYNSSRMYWCDRSAFSGMSLMKLAKTVSIIMALDRYPNILHVVPSGSKRTLLDSAISEMRNSKSNPEYDHVVSLLVRTVLMYGARLERFSPRQDSPDEACSMTPFHRLVGLCSPDMIQKALTYQRRHELKQDRVSVSLPRLPTELTLLINSYVDYPRISVRDLANIPTTADAVTDDGLVIPAGSTPLDIVQLKARRDKDSPDTSAVATLLIDAGADLVAALSK